MSASGSVTLRGIVKRHGSVTALHAIDLDIRPGEFFALLGPSGSGKTTTLRVLVRHFEAGERDVAMVFQSYALYPHMSVGENIAFPLKMIGMPAPEIERAVRDAAAKVHIEHLLARRPGQLSGGQQQRCALARAIVRKPRLFLLDEPLSNLDAKLRLETRVELKKLQRSLDVTTVYVTHDQEEALTIADRLAIFMDGRIVQVGTPEEVFARPASVDVAGFLGNPPMNLLEGRIQGREVTLGGRAIALGRTHKEGAVLAGVRPSAIRIVADGIPARVYLREILGEDTIVDLQVGEALVRMRAPGRIACQEGESVQIGFDAESLHLFDPQTRQRLAN